MINIFKRQVILISAFFMIGSCSSNNNFVSSSSSDENSLLSENQSEVSSEKSVTSIEDSSLSDEPKAIFHVNIPIIINTTSQIKIAGSFNEWNPKNDNYSLTKIDSYNYQIEIVFSSNDIGSFIEYKYVLLHQGQSGDGWTNVEVSKNGGEIANRRHQIIIGAQDIKDIVMNLKNNMVVTSVIRGTLFKTVLDMPQYQDNRKRTIRIWLPDGYDYRDKTKSYPVIYMHDGQNLFDRHTSFSGEWEIDESIGAMMDSGYQGTIVVGIDNSNDRLNELSPNWPLSSVAAAIINNPSGEKYADFIVNTVKPYIDNNFNTNPSRLTTGIGGSSMGGVMSFYMSLTYPEIFGYAMIFSPSMWAYENNTISNFVSDKEIISIQNRPKLYVYAGSLEPSITPYVDTMYTILVDNGYPSNRIATHVDLNRGHNESAWAAHFPIAYSWLTD
jgi:predicted alpha/beta superfamily hydrolase